MKYEDIPQDVINEIAFMLGSTEECQSDYLKPILEKHGYTGSGFLVIDPADDKELTLDIYNEFFATGIFKPFIWED